jgi:hypothetical protein
MRNSQWVDWVIAAGAYYREEESFVGQVSRS